MTQPTEWPKINLKQIHISESNVRTLNRTEKIEELAESIKQYGLLQPVVVYEAGEKFELIVGQRRFQAFKHLAKSDPSYHEISAIVLQGKLDLEKLKILSLSENIHRVELNRADIVDVISFLYRKHDKSAKKVAKILGVSIPTVYNYLKVQDAPDEVKKLYTDRKIGREDVRRLLEMAPDKEKMVKIAKAMVKEKLTKPQKERLPEIAKHSPQASAEELIREAKRPKIEEKIIVPLTPELIIALDDAVKDVGLGREEIVKKALEEWLKEKGYFKR